jgi:photosystem II stability/assembly factor-like uncharacterized protein
MRSIPSRQRLLAAVWLAAFVVAAAGPVRAAPTAQETLGWQLLGGPGGRITQVTSASPTEWYVVTAGGVNRGIDESPWFQTGSVRRGYALYRTTDAGATWSPRTNDLPPGPITALAFDNGTDTLLAAVQGSGDIFTRRYGLWRSENHGLTWAQAALGRDDLLIRRIARSAEDRYLYLGATDSSKYPTSLILRSADNGASWQTFHALRFGQRPGSVLVDLTPHPTDPDRLYLTTYGGELYLSDNAGETWHLPGRPEEPPLPPWSGPARLALSPDAPETAWVLRGVLSAAPATLVLERSSDGGETWRGVAVAGLPAQVRALTLAATGGETLLLATMAGAYRSVDGGATWRLLEGPLSAGSVVEFRHPGRRQPGSFRQP